MVNSPEATKSLAITFTTTQPVFDNCMKPVMSTAGALEAALNNTVAATLQLNTSVQVGQEGVLTQIRMPWTEYKSNEFCNPIVSGCSRALCQSTALDGLAEWDAERDR